MGGGRGGRDGGPPPGPPLPRVAHHAPLGRIRDAPPPPAVPPPAQGAPGVHAPGPRRRLRRRGRKRRDARRRRPHRGTARETRGAPAHRRRGVGVGGGGGVGVGVGGRRRGGGIRNRNRIRVGRESLESLGDPAFAVRSVPGWSRGVVLPPRGVRGVVVERGDVQDVHDGRRVADVDEPPVAERGAVPRGKARLPRRQRRARSRLRRRGALLGEALHLLARGRADDGGVRGLQPGAGAPARTERAEKTETKRGGGGGETKRARTREESTYCHW